MCETNTACVEKNFSYITIAIDGPSGSGKSTLAKNLAARLGFVYLDTGALYRAVGFYVWSKNIDAAASENVSACLLHINIDVVYENGIQKIFLNGEDVSLKIRENHISKYSSDVSKIPEVRRFLLNLQRNAAKSGNVIMDGRDIGTVILPNASLKIFLTASPEKRAERRYKELLEREEGAGREERGENVERQKPNYSQILNEIIARDDQDSNRSASPLKMASDAILVNNDGYDSPEDTLKAVLQIVKERLPDVCI